jgi:PAS domain-containing protein
MSSGREPRFGAVPAGTLIDAATLAMLLDHAYDAVAVRRANRSQVTVDSRRALDAAGGEQVVLEINRDVTLRLAAEESARRRERQLRFITDSAPHRQRRLP